MTSECLSWFCCSGNEEAAVDLYNISTISQVNLVSHVQDTSDLHHFTGAVYDHNTSLFRTVSNDSEPDFEILERNGKNVRIINSQPERFNPYTPAPKQSVKVTSSYPLCLSDSKQLFKKTVLDATVSMPGSSNSFDYEPNHTERRSSISKINNDIKLHNKRRGPVDTIAVVPNHVVSDHVITDEVLERDGYSFETESFDEYESVCCGLWPVKYKHSDSELDSFHYYEPVHPRQLGVPRCDAFTQTEVRGRSRASTNQSHDSAYEVVNPRRNSATTFHTVADINPCIRETNENELTISGTEHETNYNNRFDKNRKQNDEFTNSVYDDAYSTKNSTCISPSKPEPDLKTDTCNTVLLNDMNNKAPPIRKERSNNITGEKGANNAQIQYISTGDLYSVVQKHDTVSVDPNKLVETTKINEPNLRYENTDHALIEDYRQYADEPIYDDIGNVIHDSLGFTPHEEQIDLEINKHEKDDFEDSVNEIKVAHQVNDDDKNPTCALDKLEKYDHDEPLYDTIGSRSTILTKDEKDVDKISEENHFDTSENGLESTLDESIEENLYDIVGNFGNDSYKRYSATDIIMASHMLETYYQDDNEPEVIYENIANVYNTERFESSSESSDDGCGITFSAKITEHEEKDLDDESLYDVVDNLPSAGRGVLKKVSDVLKVI